MNLARKYPFLTCLIVALLLRLLAVFFSKGYMASDDYYETVKIAYQGVQSGLTDEQGMLKWDVVKPENIGRSPLYVLFLYSIMKVQHFAGITDLDSMMYLIRSIHALLSLLIIWFGYKYIFESTRDKNYALLGGLILGAHFLAPYLAVRNMIEQVSADLFLPAIFFAYIGVRDKKPQHLIMAGILSGLSWMVRFNISLAILPIPFAIWFLKRSLRPALYYTAGLLLIILFSGTLDMIYLGYFGQSSLNILRSFLFSTEPPPLPQPLWFFFLLTLGAFVPPFSFYFIFSFFRKKLLQDHLILFSAALSFFLIHTLIAHKEERFIIPIFPLLVIMGVVGLRSFLMKNSIATWNRKLFKASAIWAAFASCALLPIFTTNYGHKSIVDTFIYLGRQNIDRPILIDSTERMRLFPYEYAELKRTDFIELYSWDSLGVIGKTNPAFDSIDYVIIFSENSLQCHLDSLEKYLGRLQLVFKSDPSLVDNILHRLNPLHNHTNQSWVFRRRSLSLLPPSKPHDSACLAAASPHLALPPNSTWADCR